MGVILHPYVQHIHHPLHHVKMLTVKILLQPPATDGSLSRLHTVTPENIGTIRPGCVLTTRTTLCDVIKASQLQEDHWFPMNLPKKNDLP